MDVERIIVKMNQWKVMEIRYCQSLVAEKMDQVQNVKSSEPRRFILEL